MNKTGDFVIWFTGLSGSGKTTLANYISNKFNNNDILNYVLDGDNLRKGINSDLEFTQKDREENIRRTAHIVKIIYDCGVIPIAACISPFQRDRDFAKSLFENNDFIEVYLSTPIEICEQRDPKGLYRLAREGKILDFTGIASAYEIPIGSDVIINTCNTSLEECSNRIIQFLVEKNLIE